MKCDVDTMEGSGGEGGRSARETHTDAPTPAGGYNTRAAHLFLLPKERAHLFLTESRGEKKYAAESIMQNYTGTPIDYI